MEDVVLQLAFFVVFLGEEQHLSLSAGLLVDIFFGGVDQFEVIGIELESSGAECEVYLSHELFIWLSEASAVVGHHRLLHLQAAFAHYLLYLADSYFAEKLAFEPSR